MRVLELLKLRFGEGALQASEVMLRDIRDSTVMDRNIRDSQGLRAIKAPEAELDNAPPIPELHARILSRLFWPELQDDTFAIPPEIIELQKRYEEGFGNLKQSRRLSWLNALGQVTVELQLEDRTLTEEVHTWQASVIYAFTDSTGSAGTGKKVADLMTQLQMDEPLVRSALKFWTGKRVLREVERDVYTVLETIDHLNDVAQDALATDPQVNATGRSAEDQAMKKLKVYWQFIVGMLTNGGPMPLAQIITMLKFAVAGGFPYSEDELREYLGVMVQEDRLQFVGGRYKIKG